MCHFDAGQSLLIRLFLYINFLYCKLLQCNFLGSTWNRLNREHNFWIILLFYTSFNEQKRRRRRNDCSTLEYFIDSISWNKMWVALVTHSHCLNLVSCDSGNLKSETNDSHSYIKSIDIGRLYCESTNVPHLKISKFILIYTMGTLFSRSHNQIKQTNKTKNICTDLK